VGLKLQDNKEREGGWGDQTGGLVLFEKTNPFVRLRFAIQRETRGMEQTIFRRQYSLRKRYHEGLSNRTMRELRAVGGADKHFRNSILEQATFFRKSGEHGLGLSHL
jgi:hypothetical protein